MSTATLQPPMIRWLARSRAWISILLLVPIFVVVVFSAPHVAINPWGDFATNAAGWLLFMAGAFFRWWSTLYIGGRKYCELITKGPYSVCRNPLYLGTFLMSLSMAIFLQSVGLAGVMVFVGWFYLRITVPVEERNLSLMFGDSFNAYCEQVPRFFPRFSAYQSPELIEVRLNGLRAELFRTARWMWIPVLCQLVIHLREQAWWPRLFTLP